MDDQHFGHHIQVKRNAIKVMKGFDSIWQFFVYLGIFGQVQEEMVVFVKGG